MRASTNSSGSGLILGAVILLSQAALVAAPPKLDEGRHHWAFQPLSAAPVPEVQGGSNEVDAFILDALRKVGLPPSSPADPATLIRRVYLDLIGLPPSPEQVAAFVSDPSPRAYEGMIDDLLRSPHYGERWGRHWLDLARYADSGGVHNDIDRPHAWKYRDYVIRSFNEDKPYARFVAEQLAGDEVEGANEATLIATGFGRCGPSNDDNMGKTDEALEQYRLDQLDDVIATTSTVFLGLTVGCARCHDHKTEPVTAVDYYSLLAIFNGTSKAGLVPGTEDRNGKKMKDDPAPYHALVERSAVVPAVHVLLRGNPASKGQLVQPAVPAVLARQPLPFPAPTGSTSLRRLTLARWIASPDNALAWRVLANRVWQHHFGRGIVATPSDFGFSGARPSHPELLDHLAAFLIRHEGRLKPLHRLILLSATYRQVSASHEEGRRVDPDNKWFWRMNLRRMEAEAVRDSILAASGNLNLKVGGPGIKPRIRADLLPASQRNKWPLLKSEGPEQWRRSVYIYAKRQLLLPMMELFDAPTTTDSCSVRMESLVPTQALVLMNDEFVEDQAAHLAQRMQKDTPDVEAAVRHLLVRVLCREPAPKRLTEAVRFVHERAMDLDLSSALTDLAHVLFNSSEFIQIE